jgi:hypothetical protein
MTTHKHAISLRQRAGIATSYQPIFVGKTVSIIIIDKHLHCCSIGQVTNVVDDITKRITDSGFQY